MKSLYAKILLWFLATVAIMIVGLIGTTILTTLGPEGEPPPFRRLALYQMREASRVYETEGREALAKFLSQIDTPRDTRGILTDARGTDLVTGEDRSDLIRRMRPARPGPPPRPPLSLFDSTSVFGQRSRDGRYFFFLLVPRHLTGLWFLHSRYLWIVGAIVLLCYWLALHLTSPVRRLREALDRFGGGDLSARVRSRRSDELGQLGKSFDQMADRIETLLGAERRLLQDVSHELRSPLARLKVGIELARTGENKGATLDRIEREVDRLNVLVAGLLEVTRAEGDQASLQLEPIQLDGLLQEVVDDCSVEAEARECTLEFEAGASVEAHGNEELLRRAFENVARNAIRYAPRNTRVEIRLDSDGGRISICFRDLGPGVPEESLPHLFEPFYRVDSDRDRASGGVGLGLSIASRAVRLHNGTITARNLNPGLEIEISLPVSPH